ncbi:hypothetical protein [Actinoplanes sp. NPDC049681]|uniref:hypothetical protein n=1 Tax=Actinoplanes sp. NPDC049681 TaxID=3363905 RepID=UPI00378FF636
MRPRDYDDSEPGGAQKYRERLAEWERRRDELAAACTAAGQELVTRQQLAVAPAAWLAATQAALIASMAQASQLASADAELAAVVTEVTRIDGFLADVRQARQTATARLLDGPVTGAAITLLPLRLESRWLDDGLYVRVYPDDLLIRTHDERLTADEITWGTHYWAVGGGDIAWLQLSRRYGPQRAAWIIRACDPARPGPQARDDGWPRPAGADLLPDRFAVVAYCAGEPVAVAWGADVAGPLELTVPGGPTPAEWTTDLPAAVAAGMAVRLPVPAGAPPIDLVVAIGLHTGADARSLADLITAHAYTDGLELLADGTPTNNAVAVNSAFSPERQAAVARLLVSGGSTPADGTAGAELADVLGLPRDTFADIEGAATVRSPLDAAAGLLVGLAAEGVMTAQLGTAADPLRPLVRPGGPAPVLRTGRQPYALLPVTDPGAWVAAPGELGAGLSALMHRWAVAYAPAAATDPNVPVPPIGGGVPRRVTRADAADLPELLLESPQSVEWTAPDGTAHSGDDLFALLTAAARRAATPVPEAAVTVLADLAPHDRARLLAGHLDAASHRFDPWVTAAVTERLTASRVAHPGLVALGAVGWLTDVAPRTQPVSSEHVLAPSLGHAATAAVLRSAYLGQTGSSSFDLDLSSRRVRQALWLLEAVRAGQPLAAVLGYQFERDLADAGLQPYLAAFRKLTRFHTGTALEALEDVRRARQVALQAAQARLVELRAAAEAARAAVGAAAAARAAGQGRLDQADAVAAPYDQMSAALTTVVGTEIPTLVAELAAIDAGRPQSRRQAFTLQVP